ncbi:hypothetical protein [Brevundimonas sp. FT23028]|uniref:hypothetical protein n=1 Tax=Brevundimonas sp. FT23028 TaxID=3393748 RepID=UPI003B589F1B
MIQIVSLIALTLAGAQNPPPRPAPFARPTLMQPLTAAATGGCVLDAGDGALMAAVGQTAAVRIEGRTVALSGPDAGIGGGHWTGDTVRVHVMPAPDRAAPRVNGSTVRGPVRVGVSVGDRFESFEATWTCPA